MEFGVLLGDLPASVGPREHLDRLLRQVDAAQRNGFTTIAIGQHFLYGDIRWLQPVPVLARLAGEVGAQVRLATTVLVAPLHHPVVLAEELATLDVVTGGRLSVGLGVGYRKQEFHQLGIPFEERLTRFEEGLQIMRLLWTERAVTFRGRHWSLTDARPHITPVQQPTPPIWIGATTTAGVRRSARLGDAWPIGPRMPLPDIERRLAIYRAERAALGLATGQQPIRREIVVRATREQALRDFTAMTSTRYDAYADRERTAYSDGDGSDSALLGSPDDVRAALCDLAARLPLGPVIVRAQWPGMDDEAVRRYLDELGEHVVRPLAAAARS